MTTTIDADPMTASVFLFQRQDTGQALAEALDRHGVLHSNDDLAQRLVTRIAREAAKDQLGVVADGLLNLDLGDLVIAGWRKHERLATAAQHTAANPGSSERIQLATHRISSVHRPSVELLLNDTHLTNVNFELDIEFVITTLEVTVRQGQVVSLHSGNCDISATLTAEGVQLVSQQRTYELPLVVRWPATLHLGDGTDPLLYGAKSPPVPAPTPTQRGRGPFGQSDHRPHRIRALAGRPAD